MPWQVEGHGHLFSNTRGMGWGLLVARTAVMCEAIRCTTPPLRSPGAPLASRASPADWAIVGGHFDHWVQRAIVGGRSPFGDRSRPFP